jgi:gamma-glutamylcyclotransferase (GGCT)/AIG2-like uncharacterized protein YtfP
VADDFYFAYGSNMNPERVAARGLAVASAAAGWVDGLSLAFDKCSHDHAGIGHASVAWDPSGRVEGVVYELATEREILKMDRYERAPVNYSRDRIVVATAAGPRVCWTYFANPSVRQLGLRPDRAYLAHLLAGRAYLTPAYLDRLECTPCADD